MIFIIIWLFLLGLLVALALFVFNIVFALTMAFLSMIIAVFVWLFDAIRNLIVK
jgi:hypothetical protein